MPPEIHYLVPTETAQVLGGRYPLTCDNLSLILARYLPHEAIRNDKRQDVVYNKQGKVEQTIRANWLKEITNQFNKPQQREKLKELCRAVAHRWETSVGDALIFEMRARTRLVVGLGGKGALEFGITLHHTTGLPIIPGSALKGAARNYTLLTIAAELYAGNDPVHWMTNESLEALDTQLMIGVAQHPQANAYRRVFGSQEAAGECVFHDAVVSRLPAGEVFAVDVMTPHFSKYYTSSGGEAPHDADNPIPVSFLTVSAGTRFGFAIGARHNAGDADLIRTAAQWLASALDELGIGAKTAAGYGAFKLVND